MGNEQSEFEEQFSQIYRFVGIVEDRVFRTAKIYRKIKFNFDYMMVLERPLAEFVTASQKDPEEYIRNKLQLVRKYQNSFTVNLSYSMILEGKALGCEASTVRLYVQYYNHSLKDYLSALRASRLHLTLGQLSFAGSSLIEAILVLKKMEIEGYWLTIDNVWVSADQGKVVVNPLLFLFQAASLESRSFQVHRLTSQFQPLDLATSRSQFFSVSHSFSMTHESIEQYQIQNILSMMLELTRYLSPQKLRDAHRLFSHWRKARNLSELLPMLASQCQELNVDQFGESRQPQNLYARKE